MTKSTITPVVGAAACVICGAVFGMVNAVLLARHDMFLLFMGLPIGAGIGAGGAGLLVAVFHRARWRWFTVCYIPPAIAAALLGQLGPNAILPSMMVTTWVFASLLAFVMSRAWWRRIKSKSSVMNPCGECGYELAGLKADRCPECGTRLLHDDGAEKATQA